MATYHISVIEVHPDGDLKKNSSKYVFGPKQCLTVKEANELLAAKKKEFQSTPKGLIQYQVMREHY